MNRFRIGGLALCASMAACGWVREKTNGALNKGGELAGSAATEVIEGVTTGVERTWALDVQLSEELRTHGLKLGKVDLESGSSGKDNRLVIYLSTERTFNDTVSAVAFDKDGLEMGRTAFLLNKAAGTGDFHVVQFQDFTDLERKSRVEIK